MYTQENYNELLQQLKELADPKYQKFHSGLLPGVDNILGVSVPKLRKLAKELINSCDNIDDYLTLAGTEYYEETMLLRRLQKCLHFRLYRSKFQGL